MLMCCGTPGFYYAEKDKSVRKILNKLAKSGHRYASNQLSRQQSGSREILKCRHDYKSRARSYGYWAQYSCNGEVERIVEANLRDESDKAEIERVQNYAKNNRKTIVSEHAAMNSWLDDFPARFRKNIVETSR